MLEMRPAVVTHEVTEISKRNSSLVVLVFDRSPGISMPQAVRHQTLCVGLQRVPVVMAGKTRRKCVIGCFEAFGVDDGSGKFDQSRLP